ncbi:MAG: carbon-nitrogen hydrolase family protein [Asticcacaulis sp.]
MSLPETLDVAVVQATTPATGAEGWAHLLPLLQQAANTGAQLIVTPEGSNFLQNNRSLRKAEAVPELEDPVVRETRAFAMAHGVWVLLGSVIVALPEDAEGRSANRALLIAPTGEVAARYDKLHVFDATLPNGERYRESENVRPGTRAVVARTPFGGLGLSICYDVRFASLYRRMAMAGARLIAVPAAFTVPTGEAHWSVLLRTRAIETGCFVLAAAQGGHHADGRRTWGHSLIIDPWGRILAEASDDQPTVLSATLRLAAVDEARQALPQLWHDRMYDGP